MEATPSTTVPVSRMAKVGSWFVVLCFMAVGIWWLKHTPTVGKGGVVLAVGATLMPLCWEKVGTIGKMIWIAMLFVLMTVEYHAIDEDRAQTLADDRAKRAEQNDEFNRIATGLEMAIAQGQTQFRETISRTNSVMSNLTGGDSFAYITPVTVNNTIFLHGVASECCRDVPIMVHNHGKYMLTGVGITVLSLPDLEPIGELKAKQEFIGTLSPNESRLTSIRLPMPRNDQTVDDYRVLISAQNFSVVETLHIKATIVPKPFWAFKYLVERPFPPRVLNGPPMEKTLIPETEWSDVPRR